MGWALSSSILKFVLPPTSCCLVPSNDVKEADSRGSVIESILQESCCSHLSLFKGLGQFPPFRASNMATRDFDVSPCRKEKKRAEMFQRWEPKNLWEHAKPKLCGLVFPLRSMERKVNFSSFSLTPTSPPSSWLLAVPACTCKDHSQKCLLFLTMKYGTWHPRGASVSWPLARSQGICGRLLIRALAITISHDIAGILPLPAISASVTRPGWNYLLPSRPVHHCPFLRLCVPPHPTACQTPEGFYGGCQLLFTFITDPQPTSSTLWIHEASFKTLFLSNDKLLGAREV